MSRARTVKKLGRRAKRQTLDDVMRARCFEKENELVHQAALKMDVDDSVIVRTGALRLAQQIVNPNARLLQMPLL